MHDLPNYDINSELYNILHNCYWSSFVVISERLAVKAFVPKTHALNRNSSCQNGDNIVTPILFDPYR